MLQIAFRPTSLLVAALLVGTPSSASSPPDPNDLVSLDPSIVFVGGTASARRTVTTAVDRFVDTGLALPDLVVRIHDEPTRCKGKMGLFHRNGDKPIIDLCFQREFLALHELGHAWERFNLDDQARDRFRELVGSPPWRTSDIAHNRQGVEIAANTLAHGLLSEPVQPGQHRDREFARFEVLTGSQSPRLAEIPPRDLEAPAPLVRFNTPLKMLRLAHCSSVTARSDVV